MEDRTKREIGRQTRGTVSGFCSLSWRDVLSILEVNAWAALWERATSEPLPSPKHTHSCGKTNWYKANEICQFAKAGRERGWHVSPTLERKLLGRRDCCLISVQHRSTESKIRSPANQARGGPSGTLPRVGGDAGQGWEGHCLKSPLYANHHCRHLTQNITHKRTSEVNRIIPTVLMGKWSLSKGKWPRQGQMLQVVFLLS